MKLERLLRVPRAGRTIHLVINIPEPVVPSHPIAPSPKLTAWARIWAILKVAGPASVATAAIILSVLSLQEQSSANQAQQLADKAAAGTLQSHDAEQVSFLQGAMRQSPFASLAVENFATTPVYFTTFQVEASAVIGTNKFVTRAFTLWLGDIPACSSGTVNIVPAVVDVMRKISGLKASQIRPDALGIVVDSMYFADSSGLNWQYLGVGHLQQVISLPDSTFTSTGFAQATYKAATGCVQ